MYDVHVCLKSMENFTFNWSLMSSNKIKSKSEAITSCLIQYFVADFQPQNAEFRNNLENFHPCGTTVLTFSQNRVNSFVY